MPTIVYMAGLMGQFLVTELPEVVRGLISDAESDGEDFITVHSQGIRWEKTGETVVKGQHLEVGRPADSFTELHLRHSPIFAMRVAHPGEVPEVGATGEDVRA